MIDEYCKHRSGMTLLEVSVALTAGSVLVALVASLLVMVYRQDAARNQYAIEPLVLGRLTRQFRDDVRASTEVTRANEAGPIECRLPGGDVIEYRRDENRVHRVRHAGPKAQGQPSLGFKVTSRESFRLPQSAAIELELSDESPRVVTLVIEYSISPAIESKRRRLPIQAVVGHDLRREANPENP